MGPSPGLRGVGSPTCLPPRASSSVLKWPALYQSMTVMTVAILRARCSRCGAMPQFSPFTGSFFETRLRLMREIQRDRRADRGVSLQSARDSNQHGRPVEHRHRTAADLPGTAVLRESSTLPPSQAQLRLAGSRQRLSRGALKRLEPQTGRLRPQEIGRVRAGSVRIPRHRQYPRSRGLKLIGSSRGQVRFATRP